MTRAIELEVLPAARAYGVGVIPWSPLEGGLLGGVLKSEREGRRRLAGRAKQQVERHREEIQAYEDLCDKLGEEPASVALAWLLHVDGVTAPIIGPRTLAQLNSAQRALQVTLDEDVLARLDEIFPGTSRPRRTTPGERPRPRGGCCGTARGKPGHEHRAVLRPGVRLRGHAAVARPGADPTVAARCSRRCCWRWCGWPGPTRRGSRTGWTRNASRSAAARRAHAAQPGDVGGAAAGVHDLGWVVGAGTPCSRSAGACSWWSRCTARCSGTSSGSSPGARSAAIWRSPAGWRTAMARELLWLLAVPPT